MTQPVDPDDRRKHLDFIQSVVTRMSTASTTTKSWLLPVITAAYGYALTKKADSLALLGAAAVVLFAFLDANYLKQEKRFRRLYSAVAAGASIAAFSLDPDEVQRVGRAPEEWPTWVPRWINRLIPGPSVWSSWAVGPFYGVLLLLGLFIAFRVM